MEIADLLAGPDAVLANLKASGKKALLAELASRAATLFKLDERRLFDRLLERERLGSTGIGGGIAIPHARMATLAKPLGRSEERRVGKECSSPCRSRWSPYH